MNEGGEETMKHYILDAWPNEMSKKSLEATQKELDRLAQADMIKFLLATTQGLLRSVCEAISEVRRGIPPAIGEAAGGFMKELASKM